MSSIIQGGFSGLHAGSPSTMSQDLLHGADKIAEFLFGDSRQRRKVYYLVETKRLPIFRLGSVICARKSTLISFITHQENAISTNYEVEAA